MRTLFRQRLITPRRLSTVGTRPRTRTVYSLRGSIRSSFKSSSTLLSGEKSESNALEEPRSLPASGFTTINTDQLVEEEELPDYQADRFYPIQLGMIFQNRYQIVAKFGFGSSSTTWLARDLRYCFANYVPLDVSFINCFRAHQYVALKVYVHSSLVNRELPFYDHIAHRIEGNVHKGRSNIRKLLDSFVVSGPYGKHAVLVFEACQMSLRDMKLVFRQDGFDEDFVRGAITELLQALDFFHSHGEVVHTGIMLFCRHFFFHYLIVHLFTLIP